MSEQILPEVTAEDVLAGAKEITVEQRDSNTIKVTVKKLPWRAAIRFGHLAAIEPAEAVAFCLPRCLEGNERSDAFLDTIIPKHLSTIALVALLLSLGVNEAKARAAKKENHGK